MATTRNTKTVTGDPVETPDRPIEDVVGGVDVLPVTPVPADEWPIHEEPVPVPVHVALARVMAEVAEITKSKRNTEFNYSFRGIDDFYNAFHGPMSKHGLVMLINVADIRRTERKTNSNKAMYHVELTVEYTFVGPDGSKLTARIIGEGQDTQDKAVQKALSAAHKYALQQVFMPPLEAQEEAEYASEDTVYAPTVDYITPEQHAAIMRGLKDLKALPDEPDTLVREYVTDNGFGSLKEKTMLQHEADAVIGYITELLAEPF